MSDRMLLTYTDAAKLLSISRTTLSGLVKDKYLEVVLIPHQSRPKIHYETLVKFIEERKTYK